MRSNEPGNDLKGEVKVFLLFKEEGIKLPTDELRKLLRTTFTFSDAPKTFLGDLLPC